jgi:predicted adenylyl cyclase CyaB
MAREIEAKFRLADAAALRERLTALGARCAGTVQETNLLLDTPDRDLLARGCGLRIRVAQPLGQSGPCRVTLTYKGPRDPALHVPGIKSREEIETDVSDNAPLTTIFARLGFTPILCYEKRRETWRIAGAEVTLDELPQLGWFAEIEAPDGRAVESLRGQLGLDPAAAVRETYPELTARFGTPDSDGRRGLRFETGPKTSADERRA